MKGGFIVPFINSISDANSDLLWKDEDRLKNSTALYKYNSVGKSDELEISDGILSGNTILPRQLAVFYVSRTVFSRAAFHNSPTFTGSMIAIAKRKSSDTTLATELF